MTDKPYKPLTLDQCAKMAIAFYEACPNGEFGEFCINAGGALRACEAMIDKATELFQCDGKFAAALTCGDHCIVKGFEAMARFCERHAEQFIQEECQ